MNDRIVKISPSMLAADAANYATELKKIEAAGADYVHIDVMDGHFVPNMAISPDVVKALRNLTDMVFDVHLMISEPMKYIKMFSDAGADIITIHHEAMENPEEAIDYIHSLGKKAGVSVKPGTDIEVVAPYIEKLDLILVMTVEPGFGGQSYIEAMNEKIARTRQMIDAVGKDIELEIDGGVTVKNVHMPLKCGANVIVAGTAVFKANDIKQTIDEMRLAAK